LGSVTHHARFCCKTQLGPCVQHVPGLRRHAARRLERDWLACWFSESSLLSKTSFRFSSARI
jgi:hypothetical protein